MECIFVATDSGVVPFLFYRIAQKNEAEIAEDKIRLKMEL
jgi:hypothetical protein